MLLVAVIDAGADLPTSSDLASAYGVSVTGTMLIDTLLLIIVAAPDWRVSPRIDLAAVRRCSWSIDMAFLIANGVKFLDGAWFPVVAGHRRLHGDAHLAPRPRPACARPQGRPALDTSSS